MGQPLLWAARHRESALVIEVPLISGSGQEKSSARRAVCNNGFARWQRGIGGERVGFHLGLDGRRR